MEQLRGQHVVVTGATGRVGAAVATALVACGATVSAVARRRTGLDALRAELMQHERLNVAEADASDAAAVERLFDALERGTGPVDAVVHAVGCGGAAAEKTALAAGTPEALAGLTRAGFLAAVWVARAAVRRMAPRGRGRVVLTGSLAGVVPRAGAVVPGALTAAVVHLARALAVETGGGGLGVNVVLSGTLDTPENRRQRPGDDPTRWVAPAAVAKAVLSLLGESSVGVNGSVIELPDRV